MKPVMEQVIYEDTSKLILLPSHRYTVLTVTLDKNLERRSICNSLSFQILADTTM
jgi:hypothetical protein